MTLYAVRRAVLGSSRGPPLPLPPTTPSRHALPASLSTCRLTKADLFCCINNVNMGVTLTSAPIVRGGQEARRGAAAPHSFLLRLFRQFQQFQLYRSAREKIASPRPATPRPDNVLISAERSALQQEKERPGSRDYPSRQAH